jgi:PemK-like, MazF-like toxin of type II toxin-antitoxin system
VLAHERLCQHVAVRWILVGLVALGVVLGIVALRRRRGPTRGRPVTPVPPPRPGWRGRPAPGEIWWADVPYQDGTGSKVRPCLVVRTGPKGSAVLKITSQDQGTRSSYLRLPTAGWDSRADHDSWLDLRVTYQLGPADFRRRAGVVDTRSWKAVRRAHPTGWSA